MDGMDIYRSVDQTSFWEARPRARTTVHRELVATVLVIAAVLGCVLLMDWAGLPLPVADEFPAISMHD